MSALDFGTSSVDIHKRDEVALYISQLLTAGSSIVASAISMSGRRVQSIFELVEFIQGVTG